MRFLYWVILATIVGFFAMLAIGIGVDQGHLEKPPPRVEVRNEDGTASISGMDAMVLLVQAQDVIKADLRDPDSVRWGLVQTIQNKRGDIAVCGQFLARNGFNGYTGDEFTVSAHGLAYSRRPDLCTGRVLATKP